MKKAESEEHSPFVLLRAFTETVLAGVVRGTRSASSLRATLSTLMAKLPTVS